jgi:hypothetical protein
MNGPRSIISKGSRVPAGLSKPINATVVRVAAAIVLGAATTVAVAWSLAFYVDGSQAGRVQRARWGRGFSNDVAVQLIPTPPDRTGDQFATVTRSRRWGTDIAEVWGPCVNGNAYGSLHELVEGTSFETEMKGKFDRGQAPTAWWRADGWPLPALSAEARWSSFDALGMSKVVGGVLVGSKKVFPRDGVRILPLQPIWRGLIINTAIYVLLWYALLSVGGIRSRLRRRRGLCGCCGYKLQPDQSRCSECGEPRGATSA